MRQETQGVTETLIKNATEEFLEYGFTKASLRRIKLLWMTLLLV